MGITYIPGPSQTLAPAIATLSAGLEKFLNPNKDLQTAMQRAMASNPELVQKMADLEANAPGTMAKLGLGDLAGVVQAVPMSGAAQAENATRPGAARQAVAQQQAATSTADLTVNKNKLTQEVVQSAGKIMAASPSITFDAALKTLTGETATERQDAKTKSDVLEASKGNTLKQLARAGALPEDLSKIDWMSKARDFLNNKLPGSEVAAYFGNEDTSKSFNEALDALKLERQLAAHAAIAAMGKDRSVDNFRIQKSFQEYEKSGGVGTLQDWQSFLFDPEAQVKAMQLVKSGKVPTDPKDKNLYDIATVTKQQVNMDKLGAVTSVNDRINKQMKAVDKAETDDQREVLLNGLNQLLDERANLGGLKVKASWNDRGWLLPGRVEYKDKTGKQIDAGTVNAVLSDPMGSDIFMSGPQTGDVAQVALDRILGAKGNELAAFAKFQGQDKSPGKKDSKAIEAELKKRGLIKVVGGGQ